MFQCGPDPDLVVTRRRLADGRTLAVFYHDNKTDADLVVTDSGDLPELWRTLQSGSEAEMILAFDSVLAFNGSETSSS
ncbi:MAG: hypothetical protein V7638_3889 [Acidobacteriota bacterium]|jgi:hypothetical protein